LCAVFIAARLVILAALVRLGTQPGGVLGLHPRGHLNGVLQI
jgi:hypothetical protein